MHGKDEYLENMKQKNILFLYEFAKKTTQIILPFSLFSFIFLHASWFPLIIQSLVSNLYTFYFQIVSLACDKNYIFLLCNGILVFVARYSCQTVDTTHQPPSTEEGIVLAHDGDDTDTLQPSFDDDKLVLVEGVVDVSVYDEEKIIQVDEVVLEKEEEVRQEEKYDTECTIEREEEKEEDERPHENHDFHGDDENVYYVTEDKNERNYMFEDEDEDEEEEEEAITKMSTEELNRKFDDFIRKMKDELRFEARQQLIAV